MHEFHPSDHQDPAPALVRVLQGLPLGGEVGLPNGRTIKSVTMKQGPSRVRRFTVIPKGGRLPRQMTSETTLATADLAAQAALRKKGSK